MEPIRVLLADDHALVRAGVRALLTDQGLQVVDEVGDGRALLKSVRRYRPDIAVVDVAMPLLDGIEAARRIPVVSPKTRVVLLTMHDEPLLIARGIAAGVWAYVAKDRALDDLVRIVKQVAGGTRCLPPDVSPTDPLLTPREQEVLQLILEGNKNAQIAEIMSRSVHTVRAHRARLMRKLGARSAPQLLDLAQQRGLVVSTRGREAFGR
jgi:DNA-binding NarL/FixJ family response regulator